MKKELESIAEEITRHFAFTNENAKRVVVTTDGTPIIIGFDNIEQFEYAREKYALESFEVSDYDGDYRLGSKTSKAYPRVCQDGDVVWHKSEADEFERYYLGDDSEDCSEDFRSEILRLKKEI